MPFSVHHNVDHPLNIYAASKKSNELMAHAYSHLYNLLTTGLRFFTVYGPWGRPDMALFKFTKAILADQPIEVFGYGKHQPDFTFVDDIVNAVIRILDQPAKENLNWKSDNPDPGSSKAPWRLYNIGNGSPILLTKYISQLEKVIGKKSKIKLLPHQAGDMDNTYADVNDLIEQFQCEPFTKIEEGLEIFVKWYRDYFKV
jgi:UDP-glucuronate 4-epimerase